MYLIFEMGVKYGTGENIQLYKPKQATIKKKQSNLTVQAIMTLSEQPIFIQVLKTKERKKGGLDSIIGMGWNVRVSNACGGEILRTSPDRPRGSPSLLYLG